MATFPLPPFSCPCFPHTLSQLAHSPLALTNPSVTRPLPPAPPSTPSTNHSGGNTTCDLEARPARAAYNVQQRPGH
eukprot:757659-Amphidinium_carterae.1